MDTQPVTTDQNVGDSSQSARVAASADEATAVLGGGGHGTVVEGAPGSLPLVPTAGGSLTGAARVVVVVGS